MLDKLKNILQKDLALSNRSDSPKLYFQYLEECTSTMDVARVRTNSRDSLLGRDAIGVSTLSTFSSGDCFLVWAGKQTLGRGRGNHVWLSDNSGLYFTLAFMPRLEVKALSVLPLAIGVMIRRALQKIGCSCELKWPNDILAAKSSPYAGRKIGGILIETVSEGRELKEVIIGVGINLLPLGHQSDDTKNAIDLKTLSGIECSPVEFLGALLPELFAGLGYLNEFGFPAFREEWERNAFHKNGSISVKSGHGEPINGKQIGISEVGALRLMQQSGDIVEILSGEIGV